MDLLLATARHWCAGVLCALLPGRERARLAHREEIDAPLWSFELGLVQMFGGGAMFLLGGLAFMRPATADQSMLLLENWFPGLSSTHFQGLGLINWFAWFLYPVSWPFSYLALVGLARCVAFAVTREAMAEPVVFLAMRGWQRLRRRAAERSFEYRLGPPRPDRVERGDDGEIVVVTCREKPEWRPPMTIAIDERFYRVVDVEQRDDGEWLSLAYRLREQHPGTLIRRMVEYPAASTPRPPRSPARPAS